MFSEAGSPTFDIVVTVCDSAEAETCPVFHGRGLRVHWSAPDPAHIKDDRARQQAFSAIYDLCRSRIEVLIALLEAQLMDRNAVQVIA